MVKGLLETVTEECTGVFHIHQKNLLSLQTLLDVSALSDLFKCILSIWGLSLIPGHNSIILSLFLDQALSCYKL